ncbi:NACHT domain-containing protein [Actinosynnema sp. NPDC059797]
MRRSFSYADAVKLLGGDTALVKFLDHASAGAVLAAGGIDLLDARTEVVRVGRQLLASVRERVTGLHRVDRTRLLEAAHGVLVVTALFEALDEAELPVKPELSRGEQVALVTSSWAGSDRWVDLMTTLLGTRLPLPNPESPPERVAEDLSSYYAEMTGEYLRFLAGFEGAREVALPDVPGRALERYRGHYRRLALDCPEFGVWTSGIEHAATRTALGGLRELLERVAGHLAPDVRRDALANAYRPALRQPVVDGDLPAGLVAPTLEQAYVAPLFRVAETWRDGDAGREGWWSEAPIRSDLDAYLAGYLTSSRATRAPLVVLGQPGAGKSLLTKVLAARLPGDLLPIRVVLRDVPAESDLQEQVEHAVRAATGERVDWPDLARAAAPAVPVVLLDGFDELLQATGVSRSDYLVDVQRFQQRELEQGRAVVVVVTSRVAVADRARFPAATVVLRLEPFGEEQVRQWLGTWNRVNPGAPLDPEVALQHAELAGQPLLLFMLALYNADGCALRGTASLDRAQLYEQLLTRFARREVVKHLRDAPDRELDRAVEQELIRLSVIAFAMFNRGAQWVEEADLDEDLNALFPAGPRSGPDRRIRLSAAQLAVGRFFFVHEARSAHDGRPCHTYEFLHATFGEYLVARLVHRVSLEVVAGERAASSFHYKPRADDTGWLRPLLSFAPLTTRSPVPGFLHELFAGAPEADRESLHHLFTRLLGAAQHHQDDVTGYEPRVLPLARRVAAYTANLVVLVVSARGEFAASSLPGEQDAVRRWRALALLWESQFDPEEFRGFVFQFDLARIVDGERRDVVLKPASGRPAPPAELTWFLDDFDTSADVLRRYQNFRCSPDIDWVHDSLEPLLSNFRAARMAVPSGGKVVSLTRLLVALLAAGVPDERVEAYNALGEAQRSLMHSGSFYYEPVLKIMAGDPCATPDLMRDIVEIGTRLNASPDYLIVCARRMLVGTGENQVAFEAINEGFRRSDSPARAVEVLIRCVELGIDPGAHITRFRDVPAFLRQLDLAALAEADPGLVTRLGWAMTSIGLGHLLG